MMFLVHWMIFRFHVHFSGCTFLQVFYVVKCDCFFVPAFDPNSGITLSCHRGGIPHFSVSSPITGWLIFLFSVEPTTSNDTMNSFTTSFLQQAFPCRIIGRPSPISTRLLRPITRRAALPRRRSKLSENRSVFQQERPKMPWGENSNEVHAPVKDHVQPAKGQLDDICSLFWVMFVMWGVLFHSFHSCLEETNTIISSKSGLEPKQVLLLTALMDKILPTNLVVGLGFTVYPGIHRVLYLPGCWSSDFVHEMLRVVSSTMGFLDDIPSLKSDSWQLQKSWKMKVGRVF